MLAPIVMLLVLSGAMVRLTNSGHSIIYLPALFTAIIADRATTLLW